MKQMKSVTILVAVLVFLTSPILVSASPLNAELNPDLQLNTLNAELVQDTALDNNLGLAKNLDTLLSNNDLNPLSSNLDQDLLLNRKLA